jgi:hypothetical protein
VCNRDLLQGEESKENEEKYVIEICYRVRRAMRMRRST